MLSATTIGRPSSISSCAKHEVLLEIGGVEHDDQHFGLRLARELAEHDLAGHFLVGAGGVEA